MKKLLILLCSMMLVASPLWAEEAATEEMPMDHASMDHGSMDHGSGQSGLFAHNYVAIKLGSSMGETVDHHGDDLKGQAGSGYAFDIGTSVMEHVSVEFTYAVAGNTFEVEESEGDGAFTSMGLLGVYAHHYESGFSSVLKAGYISESEALTVHHEETKGSASGLVVVLAGEYEITHGQQLLLEYEKALFASAKGATIYAGWKYEF